MWLDAEAVAHTVALPHPREVLPGWLLRAIDEAPAPELLLTDAALEEEMDTLYEHLMHVGVVDEQAEAAYVDRAPSREELDVPEDPGRAALPELAVSYELRVSGRWRLDALCAIQDVLGEHGSTADPQ